jgi:beta-glucosidase/6-phospho-beta-glucosidase/beta-galactosidase
MRKYLILVSILIATGCATTMEKEVAQNSETHCEKLSGIVSGAVAMKWASRQSSANSTAKEKALMDWRFLAVVNHEALTELGLSQSQIKNISKEIFDTDVMNSMTHDMLSFDYYTKEQCEMLQQGLTAKSIKELKPSIQQCWYKTQEMDSEVCISKVVTGEIEL